MDPQLVNWCVCITELLMGSCKVTLEVDPYLFDNGPSHLFSDITAKDIMLRDDNETKIAYLGWREWASIQLSYLDQIFYYRKDDVNRPFDRIRHSFKYPVFGAQLL